MCSILEARFNCIQYHAVAFCSLGAGPESPSIARLITQGGKNKTKNPLSKTKKSDQEPQNFYGKCNGLTVPMIKGLT